MWKEIWDEFKIFVYIAALIVGVIAINGLIRLAHYLDKATEAYK